MNNTDQPPQWVDPMFPVEPLVPFPVQVFPFKPGGNVGFFFTYGRDGDNSQSVQLRRIAYDGIITLSSVYALNTTGPNAMLQPFLNEQTWWGQVIEGDVDVIFTGTGQYMEPVQNINRTGSTTLGQIVQAYCGALYSTPTDGTQVQVSVKYQVTRPLGYNARVSIDCGGTYSTNAGYNIVYLQPNILYDAGYPTGTFEAWIYRKNSGTSDLLYSVAPIQQGQTCLLFGQYWPANLQGYNYYCDIKVKLPDGTLIAGRFARINLTIYMGAALLAARMSGTLGTTFALELADTQRGAQLQVVSSFDDQNEVIPDNQEASYPYLLLFLKPTLVNQDGKSYAVTAWINYSNTGMYSVCRNALIIDQSLIPLRTGGKNQSGSNFKVSSVQNMVSLTSSLTISVTQVVQGSQVALSTRFTAVTSTDSLQALITFAQQYPNTLVQGQAPYIYTCGRSRQAQEINQSLTFQLHMMYVTEPTPPPVLQNTSGFKQVNQEEAIEYAQDVVQQYERRQLTSRQENYDFQSGNANPLSMYFNPNDVEGVERLKEDLRRWTIQNPTYREADLMKTLEIFNSKTNSAQRVQYPHLSNIENQKNLLEFYPKIGQSILDVYGPLNPDVREPYYEGLSQLSLDYQRGQQYPLGDLKHLIHQNIMNIRTPRQQALYEIAVLEPKYWAKETKNFYFYGTPYVVHNDTQTKMRLSIDNYNIKDIYDPQTQNPGPKVGIIPSYIEYLRNRPYDNQANTILALNLAAQKKLDEKKSSNSMLQTFQNGISSINPQQIFINQMLSIGTTFASSEAQNYLLNQFKDSLKDVSTGNIMDKLSAPFTDMPIYPEYKFSEIEADSVAIKRLKRSGRHEDAIKLAQLKGYLTDPLTQKSLPSNNPIISQQAKESAISRIENIMQSAYSNENQIYTYDRDIEYFREQNQYVDNGLFYSQPDPPFYDKVFTAVNIPYRAINQYIERNYGQDIKYVGKGVNYAAENLGKGVNYAAENVIKPGITLAIENAPTVLEAVNKAADTLIDLEELAKQKTTKLISDISPTVVEGAVWTAQQAGYASYLAGLVLGPVVWDLLNQAFSVIQAQAESNVQRKIKRLEKYQADYELRNEERRQQRRQQRLQQRLQSLLRQGHQKDMITMVSRAENQQNLVQLPLDQQEIREPISNQKQIEKDIQLVKVINEQRKDLQEKAYQAKQIKSPHAKFVQQALDIFDKLLPVTIAQYARQPVTSILNNQDVYSVYKDATDSYNLAVDSISDYMNRPVNITMRLQQQKPQKKVNSTEQSFQDYLPSAKNVIIGAAGAGAAYGLYKGVQEVIKSYNVSNDFLDATMAQESPADIQALQDDNITQSTGGRLMQLHAFRKSVNNLFTTFKVNNRLQTVFIESFKTRFALQSVKQKFAKNFHGYLHFKALKSLLAPEDYEEKQLARSITQYFEEGQIYDAKNTFNPNSKENRVIDQLQIILRYPSEIHQFIERLTHKRKETHQTAFNQAQYARDRDRPVYNTPDTVQLRRRDQKYVIKQGQLFLK